MSPRSAVDHCPSQSWPQQTDVDKLQVELTRPSLDERNQSSWKAASSPTALHEAKAAWTMTGVPQHRQMNLASRQLIIRTRKLASPNIMSPFVTQTRRLYGISSHRSQSRGEPGAAVLRVRRTSCIN